jgi:hypothetical protein
LKILIERIDDYMQMQRSLGQSGTEGHQSAIDEELSSTQGLVSASGSSPLFMFPPELLEDWSWAFDFTQSGT